jgi:hypothetical protein
MAEVSKRLLFADLSPRFFRMLLHRPLRRFLVQSRLDLRNAGVYRGSGFGAKVVGKETIQRVGRFSLPTASALRQKQTLIDQIAFKFWTSLQKSPYSLNIFAAQPTLSVPVSGELFAANKARFLA